MRARSSMSAATSHISFGIVVQLVVVVARLAQNMYHYLSFTTVSRRLFFFDVGIRIWLIVQNVENH